MVKEYVPFCIMVLAAVTVALSLFGEDSYYRLSSLKQAITQQETQNQITRERVSMLRDEVIGLRESPRVLEKAARNELGLSRPNEEIFIFEKRGKANHR